MISTFDCKIKEYKRWITEKRKSNWSTMRYGDFC